MLLEGEPALLNVFSLLPIDARRISGVDAAAAAAFVDYVLGTEGQRLIADFGRAEQGRALFLPLEAIPDGTWR